MRDAWKVYRAAFWRYVAIAAAAFVVLQLASVAVDARSEDAEGAALALWTAIGAVVVIGSFIAYAALVHGGRGHDRAAPAVADAYGATRGRMRDLLTASVVSLIGISLGALLIFPGLYLAVRWSLVFQAIMLEQRGWRAAFGRSAELVRGRGWAMLGVVLVTFALTAVAFVLPLAAERWLPLPDLLSGWIVGVAAASVAFPYFALLSNAAHALLAAERLGSGSTVAA